ncbi:hypothetical protein V6N13_009095 [Hibiscus sabdariffa]
MGGRRVALELVWRWRLFEEADDGVGRYHDSWGGHIGTTSKDTRWLLASRSAQLEAPCNALEEQILDS